MTDYKDIINNLLRHYSDEYWAGQAADAMEHLINEYKWLDDFNDAVCKEYRKVKKERDAAIADIERYCRYCIICKNADFTDDYTHNRCHKCPDEDNRYFEWRGAQEVGE